MTPEEKWLISAVGAALVSAIGVLWRTLIKWKKDQDAKTESLYQDQIKRTEVMHAKDIQMIEKMTAVATSTEQTAKNSNTAMLGMTAIAVDIKNMAELYHDEVMRSINNATK